MNRACIDLCLNAMVRVLHGGSHLLNSLPMREIDASKYSNRIGWATHPPNNL